MCTWFYVLWCSAGFLLDVRPLRFLFSYNKLSFSSLPCIVSFCCLLMWLSAFRPQAVGAGKGCTDDYEWETPGWRTDENRQFERLIVVAWNCGNRPGHCLSVSLKKAKPPYFAIANESLGMNIHYSCFGVGPFLILQNKTEADICLFISINNTKVHKKTNTAQSLTV